MTTSKDSYAIHPPTIILAAEVQRPYNFTNENEHVTEFDNDGNDNRCSKTVTTISTGESSGIGTRESYKLSSGPSTSNFDESQDNSSFGEETNALSWARQAIQDAIDKHTIEATTSPEESASALIRSRQQLRQQIQQQACNSLPLTNSHPSDESAQLVKPRCTMVNMPSPTLVEQQQSTKKSMILSHRIDRHGSDFNNVPLFKTVESNEKNPSNVIAAIDDCSNNTSSKTTPNTSRSSSPSASLSDVKIEIDEERTYTTPTIERDDIPTTPSKNANIADNITNIDSTCQNNADDLALKPATHQHRLDDANDTRFTNETYYKHPIIDLALSTSKSQSRELHEVNETSMNSIGNTCHTARGKLNDLDDSTFATSQSNDLNIDPNTKNYVTSSVRDYIDSMHSNKIKTIINIDSSVEGRHNAVRLKSLEVNTKPHDFHDNGLIEYLSAKASTKNVNKSFGIDPPSTTEDEVAKVDPPITLTESEVTRSAVKEPEMNPLKAFTSSVEHHNVTASDPDVSMPPILYDELGERSRTTARTKGLDNSVENTNLFCETIPVASLYLPQSEKVVDTPKRKTTVVTIPKVTTAGNKDEILTKDTFEPDGRYPSSAARDFVSSIHRLHYLLTGNDDVTDFGIQQIGKLVQFSSLFLDPRLNITSYGTSQIMTRANELNVSLHITDRYLDAIRSMGEESQTTFNDMEDVYNLTQFVLELNVHIEKLTGRNLREEIGETIKTDISLPIVSSIPEDAFEVEVNDGYTNVDFRPCDDEEPWWEVVARLNGTTCPDSNSCLHRDGVNCDNEEATILSNIDNSKLRANLLEHSDVEPQNLVERDIAKFWIEREKIGRHPEVLNLPNACNLIVKKAHSYSGQGIAVNCRKSKRISKTRSSSSTSSNISQHSLRSMRRKWSTQQFIGKTTEEVPTLNAVSATSAFFDKDNKLRIFNSFSNVWKLSYAERTQHHEGYFDVDKYSLYAASAVQTYRHPLDCVAWESRSVKQRFMYEHSISFTRNWFGCLTEVNLNPVISEPICRPKSMEMPMEADEWTEEWFLNRNRLCHDRDDDNHEYDDDNLLWGDERPECGRIRNVRLRIGEKITRVTPDLTSHVRRSRWRKKHFPPGTFPYV
jgi:hypothetical protein